VDHRCAQVDLACDLVLTDYRGNVQENRRISIADFHHIKEHLSLPGIGNGRRVIKPVAGYGGWAESSTPYGEKEYECQKYPPGFHFLFGFQVYFLTSFTLIRNSNYYAGQPDSPPHIKKIHCDKNKHSLTRRSGTHLQGLPVVQ
jgi:hypothetical protein